MAEEASRIIKRKRIGSVDVPVIVRITFKDDADRGWESQYTIDNSAQADRDTHVATLIDGGTDETGQQDGLKVERIDMLRVLDAAERGQESFFAPDSRTVNEPPDAPPYFITHAKTHIVRYINTPDDGSSLESELIDEIRFNDPNDRGQDTYIVLANPPGNQNIDGITIGNPIDGSNDGNGNPIYTIQVDPNLEEISDSENGIDPPWRIDPFQNLVRIPRTITYAWYYRPTPIEFLEGTGGTKQCYNFYPWQGPGIFNGEVVPIVPGDFVLTGGPVVQGVTWPGQQPWPFTPQTGQALVSWDFDAGENPPNFRPQSPGGPPWLYLAGPNQPEDLTSQPYVTIQSLPGDPNPSVSHTWNFEALKFAEDVNSGYINTGTLATSIADLNLKVKGITWPCFSVSVFMFSYSVKPDPYDPDFAGDPGNSPSPVFFATFREP